MRPLALIALLSAQAVASPGGPFLDTDLGADSGLVDEHGLPESLQRVSCPTEQLVDGEQLQPMPDLYKIWHDETAWGTPDLNEVIRTAAEEMAWLLPDADPIVVGDMSRRRGGPLNGHKSHRSGLDADLGLYVDDHRQQTGGFMDVKPSELDVEATWYFIRSMLDTGMVERILLDQSLINRLRRYLMTTQTLTPDEVERIFPTTGQTWSLTGIVHHAPRHKNHMHLRVLCSDGLPAR